MLCLPMKIHNTFYEIFVVAKTLNLNLIKDWDPPDFTGNREIEEHVINVIMRCSLYKLCRTVDLTSLVAQMVKNLPAVRETQVQSVGQDDPLEKGMATHSSILAWRIPWREESGRLWSMGSKSQTGLSD